MESASGVVALAVVLLWLGYYVPHRVRQRQQLLEARTEDRFSGALRVLAVAGPRLAAPDGLRVGLDGAAAIAGGPTGEVRALLGAAPAVTGEQDRPSGRRDDEEEDAMQTSVGAAPPQGAPPARPPASRLALLERRAAAARRRLALTVVLLLASVVVWVVVGLGLAPWWAGAIPTALLALVLVLGRRAVLSARRADAAWLAERRRATRPARAPAGAPAAPRNVRPRVTGRAVHGSQVSTQMIPRVTPQDLARATATATASATATATAQGAPRSASAREASSSRASGSDDAEEGVPAVVTPAPAGGAETPVVAENSDAVEGSDGPEVEHVPSGRAWDPVPVPRPTYTMKAPAPRREPAPLTDGDVTSAADDAAPVPVSAPEPADGDVRKPSTETLGLALDEILARRRASGQ
ncbi:hypothetical protein [Cellulosimicrobium marinum]|uniref:hypothetical protein n=1 Tax=Cellulosimicrobium marinum TaxID=1638992 RepID=UPI001E5CFAD5|nr:hypothetical protein [Cellulosimicrobium marinum]MCB7136984.1 hypothetical protein [Cellulosimicrobium marinum]